MLLSVGGGKGGVAASSMNSASFSVGAEASFTVTSPMVDMEVKHVVASEHRHRSYMLDEEAAMWLHLRRMEATDRIATEADMKAKKASALTAERPSNTSMDAPVAPIMVRYVEFLKNEPEDTTLNAIRDERMLIAKETEILQRASQRLSDEVEGRKAYTDAVKRNVANQIRQREEAMHARMEQSQQHQRDLVAAAAAKKREAMDADREKRVNELKYRVAFVKAHGDYESRVAEGDHRRMVRLTKIPPKVVASVSDAEQQRIREIENAVKQRGEARRAEAQALAARQQQLLDLRVDEMEQLQAQQRALQTRLREEADAQLRAALQKKKEADAELAAVERERERVIFLNRMTCNQAFNQEVERLRATRKQQRKEKWEAIQAASKEKQAAAADASRIQRLNEGKRRVLDRLMVEEALTVQEAEARLEKRGTVEAAQLERIARLEHEDCSKFKLLEELYRHEQQHHHPHGNHRFHHRKASSDAHLSEAVAVHQHHHQEAPHMVAAPSAVDTTMAAPMLLDAAVASDSPSNHRATASSSAHRHIEQDIEQQQRILAQKYPPRRSVLAPLAAERSLAFPTPSLLRQPPTSNPRILELAERLHALEAEQKEANRQAFVYGSGGTGGSKKKQKDAMTREERRACQQRLTERSAPQDAQQFAFVEERPKTIHDGVPPQSGAPPRLLAPLKGHVPHSPSPSPSPSPSSAARNRDGFHEPPTEAEALRAFTHRFYTGPMRTHEQVQRASVSNVLASIPVRKAVRLTDKELRNVVERLHSDTTRHLSPGTEQRMRAMEDVAETRSAMKIHDAAAVERFYTAQVDGQRNVIRALDDKYLKTPSAKAVSPYA